ncbi:MAG: hypothetical protein ACM3Q4_07200, partial [Acidobacteriota bacterium]
SAVTYTISGNAGAPGVTLGWTDSTARTVVSDTAGNYSFTVSYRWTGTVTPSLAGKTFTPAAFTYTNVMADQPNQNYTIGTVTYTISGNAGKAGVAVSWTDGTAKSTVSDSAGRYSITVPYHWSGSVTPSLVGSTFTPASIAYAMVASDQAQQDFAASAVTYTISGSAKAGTLLAWTDGTSRTVVVDSTGTYAITVSYNWSGTLTPSLAGSVFTPASIVYANVMADQPSQNFTASGITYTISGNAGRAGAVLAWTDTTAKSVTADSAGNYAITVSYHWTGTVTPSFSGSSFIPAQRSYTSVVSDQTAQNYSASMSLTVKVFLQGPFSADTMTTALNWKHLIPLTSDSAYASADYGYAPRTVAAVPGASIVDWILVELRTGTAANTKQAVVAGFLKKDGTVVDLDGVSPLSIPVNAGSYYIVVRHRNHLPVMSASAVALSSSGAQYDFTTAQSAAYGVNAMVALGAQSYGMAAGSNDGGILITTSNYNAVGRNVFTAGYLAGDHNMNGSVFIDDYNFVGTNLFLISQVP